MIDLRDLPFVPGQMSETVTYDSATKISHLSFTNGSATIPDILFLGDYRTTNWTLTSDGHGGTMVADPPNSGTATIDSGATLDISAASAVSVSFANSSGTTGALVLNDSADFTGVITGFAGDGTLSNSDSIDLKDIAFSTLTTETYVENSDGTGGTLTVSDGTQTANINFSGNYVLENFNFSSDGSGGTLVIDPPVNSALSQESGTATIEGTLDIEAPTTTNVVFAPAAAGTLRLGDSFHFNGTISGFAASDTIDLANVGSANASISYHENAGGTGGTLAISDGAQTVVLSLLGHYTADNFSIVPGQATGTVITYHDLHV
jgi:hypothetical protein